MSVDINKIFGELRYETSFERDYSLIFLGETRNVTLIVNGDEDVDFEKSQYSC